MPSLNSDNDLAIQITTSADNSGVDEANQGLATVGKTTDATGKQARNFSDDFSSSMKKISVATGVVGAGLALYAKSSTDYLVGLVKDSKALATQTGMTAVEASQLLAVLQHFGIDAAGASVAFRTLTKDIQTQRTASADTALQHEALNNKIAATKIQIKELTTEMAKNGDSSGKIKNTIEGLNIQLKAYEKQLSDTSGPLEKLHIATQNADGSNKSFNDILMNVADRFKEMPDGVEKSALAVQLFGRSGTSMIKVLNQGSQGLIQLEDNAKRLGLTLTQDNIVAVTKYIASQKQLTETNNALKISVGTLTAPLLTNLNLKVNELARAALSTDSPIRGLLVNVLAFGGPVLGATSAVTGFLGSIVQAGPAFRVFGGAITGIIGLLQSPWVIAFAAATLGIGLLAGAIFNNKNQTDSLTVAQNNLKNATNDLKLAQDGLKDSQFNQRGAALAVEGAQRNYNQAVKDFGPNSYEARDALYNLEAAQKRLRDAQDQTKDSQQKLLDKEREVAKDRQIANHLVEARDKADDVTRAADGAVISLNKLAQHPVVKNQLGGKIDLSPLLKKKAKGGPVSAGEPVIVGDNPDGSINSTSEIFVPDRSGTIIPGDQTNQLLKGGGRGGGVSIVQHIYNQVDYSKGIAEIGFRLASA